MAEASWKSCVFVSDSERFLWQRLFWLFASRGSSIGPDGKVVPHPYTVPDGCYYLLGDNPGAANDSRMWGALPEAEIHSRYPTQVEPVRVWPGLGIGVVVVLAVLFMLVRSSKKTIPIPAPPRDTT